MFCTNCGKENPDGAKFCENCGKKIEEVVEDNAVITSETMKKKKNIKFKRKYVIVLVIIVGIAGTLFLGKTDSEVSSKSNKKMVAESKDDLIEKSKDRQVEEDTDKSKDKVIDGNTDEPEDESEEINELDDEPEEEDIDESENEPIEESVGTLIQPEYMKLADSVVEYYLRGNVDGMMRVLPMRYFSEDDVRVYRNAVEEWLPQGDDPEYLQELEETEVYHKSVKFKDVMNSDLENIQDMYEAVDIDVSEAKIVTVEATIDGITSSIEIPVIKIDGAWYFGWEVMAMLDDIE